MTLEFASILASMSRPQMDALLNTALGLVGVQSSSNSTTVFVEHEKLDDRDRARVQAVLDSYVFDPDYGALPAEKSLPDRVSELELKVVGLMK